MTKNVKIDLKIFRFQTDGRGMATTTLCRLIILHQGLRSTNFKDLRLRTKLPVIIQAIKSNSRLITTTHRRLDRKTASKIHEQVHENATDQNEHTQTWLKVNLRPNLPLEFFFK